MKTKKQIYKEIKRKRIVGPIIFFILMMAVVGVGVYFSVKYFVSYTLDNKMTTEYENAENMAEIYDAGGEGRDAFKLLDKFGRSFFVVDQSGKVVLQKGENTSGTVAKKVELKIFDSEEYATVYTDTELNVLDVDKDNKLTLNYRKFAKYLESEEYESKHIHVRIGDEDLEIENLEEEYDDYVDIPIWISFSVRNGQETLFVQGMLHISEKDLLAFVIIVITVTVIALITMILLLSRAIAGIHRQKKTINFFFTDTVTGGRNWMYFILRGEQLLCRGKNKKSKYAVVSLDLKKYRNYCLCHSVAEGEKLLRNVHDLLSTEVDKKSELFAHGESSNFALILRCEDEDRFKMRLYELIRKLEKLDNDHRFNFQAGVSVLDIITNDKGRIVRRKSVNLDEEYNKALSARESLAESDESGVVIFGDKLVEEERWLDQVQEHQEKALNMEEFEVYYQPKYDPRSKELRGAEALIRWQSPELGFVSPGRFIPIFEKNGFITNIDHYMISHVAADQKRWMDDGLKCVPVSVNVSRAHFAEEDLAEQIRDMIDKAGTPHNLIEIELTESAFFDDKKAMVNTINKLKEYGFAVSMDDFGSGYSSLNSLKDMPLDVLKLDAEFFRGDESDGRGRIVVSEAIKLAQSLNMRTVAEGVEIKEQVDFLASEGCDMIQGYYFAKPMPKNDYRNRMETGRAVEATEDNKTEKPVNDSADKTEEPVNDGVDKTEEPVNDGANKTEEATDETVKDTE